MNLVSVAAHAALATILLFSLVFVVSAGAPALPCEFYGSVSIDGQPASAGTIVVAKINDIERGQYVLDEAGVYGGPGTFDRRLKVVAEESDLKDGTPVITFWIDGQKAWQEMQFQPGISLNLDLSLGGPEPTPVVIEEVLPVTGTDSDGDLNLNTADVSDSLFADFTADSTSGEIPLQVIFTDLSTGDPTSWNWDFGDGFSDTIQNPIHVYNEEGSFTVTLTISDGTNSDTEQKDGYITVTSEGVVSADFSGTPRYGNPPLTVEFTDLSSGDPMFWNWDFGDGTSDSVADPVHTYSVTGLYTVSLTASNEVSTDTETKSGYIEVSEGKLLAEFTADPQSGEAPMTVMFTDQSTGDPTSWYWDFGDGTTETSKDPYHVYQIPGLYSVSLTVSNDEATDTIIKESYISVLTPGQIIADFSAAPLSGSIPLKVSFKDISTGNPTLWAWDFGDGTGDIVQNPVHTYQDAGTYTVTLTASNDVGDLSTKVKENYISAEGVPTPEPTMTPIAVPPVPETFFGTVLMYGEPIQSGGLVEARVPGYDISGTFNPIKTAKLVFGKNGTFSPKLQVQNVPPGSEIEFWVSDPQNRLTRAYVLMEDDTYGWGLPYEPGKEKEIHLALLKTPPTIIPPIPVTPIPTGCAGVPSIPMTIVGSVHITDGTEYLYSGSCMNCEPNIQVDGMVEARIEGYDVSGPTNPITLNATGYFGGGNSTWADKLSVQGRCVPEDMNLTFWVKDANWQRYDQAWIKDGNQYYREIVFDPGNTTSVDLWVGPQPSEIQTPTPTPTPEAWQPQMFYGNAEFNGYPLRAGDRVMATTEGVDLTSPTNPIMVKTFGKYGDPSDNDMLTVEVSYTAMNQSDPILFWIKPQGFEYWYRAEVTSPIASGKWLESYPFTPGSITNVDLRSSDRVDFLYFYDIATQIKNVILPDDYSNW